MHRVSNIADADKSALLFETTKYSRWSDLILSGKSNIEHITDELNNV